VLLVCLSEDFAHRTVAEVEKQLAVLPTRDVAAVCWANNGVVLAARDADEAIALSDDYAPEHLEIMVREPRNWLRKVRAAGAVFVGTWTPEAVGDFVAGPSHVLPTGGTATLFSGLTVDDFRRRTSFMAFTRADLQETLPVIEAFARVEGLDGHGQSARIRFRTP